MKFLYFTFEYVLSLCSELYLSVSIYNRSSVGNRLLIDQHPVTLNGCTLG